MLRITLLTHHSLEKCFRADTVRPIDDDARTGVRLCSGDKAEKAEGEEEGSPANPFASTTKKERSPITNEEGDIVSSSDENGDEAEAEALGERLKTKCHKPGGSSPSTMSGCLKNIEID